MSPFTKAWNVFRRRRLDDELRAELESHVALLEDDERDQGKSPAEARLSARSRFGNQLLYRERAVDSLVLCWLDDLWRDIRYGIRQLGASPVLTTVLILTLGLGIGGTLAIFSVVDAVLLRPLPYAKASRMVIVWETFHDLTNGSASAGHFHDWTEQNTVLEDTAAVLGTTYSLAEAGDPERLIGARVTTGYFRIAAIPPVAGHYFTDEDLSANPRLVVLSELLWRRRFAADPGIIGREIRLSGEPYTVSGVAPLAFALTDARRSVVGGFSSQLWTPLIFAPEQQLNYGAHTYRVLATLKPDVSRAQAQRDLERVTHGIAERQPMNMDFRGVNVQSFREALVGNTRTQALLLFGAVSLVLLIGCVNVSSLLLARSATRSKEMAIRAALGVGRQRIVRQLLTESLVLAAAGGLVAIIVAAAGIRFLVTMGPPEVPRLREAGLNSHVMLFALALTSLTGILFGLAPALRVARADLQHSLREGGKGSPAGGSADRLRGALVIAEIAISLVLVVGAGLLIRSVWRIQQVPLGFSTEKTLMARAALPAARYASPEAIAEGYRRMLEAVRAIPGIERAGASTDVPMNLAGIDMSVQVEGRNLSVGEMPTPQFHMATDGYLETIGMALKRGRYLLPDDMRPGAPRVTVINQKLADTIWPGEDPIGKRIACCTFPVIEWREVVGVVADARTFGQFTPVPLEMFVPYMQAPERTWGFFQRSMAFVVRSKDAPGDAALPLRRAISSIDPTLPLYAVQTFDEVVAISTDGRRFNMLLLALLAGMGLALAAVGIYGIVAYFVTRRTSEIGLRLALGATSRSVVGMVLRQALALTAMGIAGGMLAALAVTRALTSLLFEISSTDVVSYAFGVTFLFGLALLASALPAIRATRINPVRSLAEL
jgi:putative ABC transport system permease protein